MELAKKKFGLRRILSVLLCLSMLLSPIVALAEGEMLAADEPTSIMIQESKTDTVYKLVENYTAADISTSKTYMIVSTDVPGAASALGAKDNSESFMQTRNDLKVFEVPVVTDSLSVGKYVTNTFSTPANGEWKFESAGSGRYYLYTTSTLGDAFLCTHCNGGTGGYHSGHMMLISRENAITNKWTRTCKFAIATDKVDLGGLNTVYPSAASEKPGGVTAGEDGYLSYGEYDGYYDNVNKGKFTDFNIVTSGSAKTRVQLYEKVGSRPIPEIKGYLYSNLGVVAVGTGKFAPTGAYIHLYVDGKFTRVPVTTDMLSGADLTKAGTYVNVKVSYNGVELADDFTLEVKSTVSIVANGRVESTKDSTMFSLVDPDTVGAFIDGGYIHIAESQNPGYVRLLKTDDGRNVSTQEVFAYEIFVDGERQLVINSAPWQSIWIPHAAGHVNLPNAKCWTFEAFNRASQADRYLRFNGNDDLGGGAALTVGAAEGWQAIWNDRNEKTGIAVYNPGGTVTTNNGIEQQNHKWRTMYYNYTINNFGLRIEQADGNATGYKPSNQDIKELREPQPQDRVYYYARTSEYANATVYLTKNEGTVPYGATSADSPTGVYLVMTVTDAYGASHVTNIPVTLDMLTYKNADGVMDSLKTKTAIAEDVIYNNVTITYQGIAISENFKVTVEQKLAEDNYPTYPAPGSVKITKELDTGEHDYLATGLTEVQLSLTGVPDASGADVVLVLDNSGSMAYSADPNSAPMPNNSKARRNEMVASIKTMLKKFAETIDGYKSDISVSILTFDGYTLIDGDMFIKKMNGESHPLATTHNQADTAHFLTPKESLAAMPSIENRFIHSSELTDEKIDEIADSFGMAYSGSGTNYDQGLHLAYETLAGKQKLNAQAGTKRNPYLIFMSDGCTWQYNYVGGGSEIRDKVDDPPTGIVGYQTWDYYLNGNLSAIPAGSRPSNTARYEAFANSEGRHWMAEAIKGDTDKRYKTINPSANPSSHYVEWVNGLGAEVFVVGFGMAADNAISRDTAVGVLKRISTDDGASGHFYDVAKSGQINEVFEEVATKIRAASNAVFEDQLGTSFDLQMAATVVNPKDETNPIVLNPRPSIEIYEYLTYRYDQIGTIVDNKLVTEDMVGKDIPTLLKLSDVGTPIGDFAVTKDMVGTAIGGVKVTEEMIGTTIGGVTLTEDMVGTTVVSATVTEDMVGTTIGSVIVTANMVGTAINGVTVTEDMIGTTIDGITVTEGMVGADIVGIAVTEDMVGTAIVGVTVTEDMVGTTVVSVTVTEDKVGTTIGGVTVTEDMVGAAIVGIAVTKDMVGAAIVGVTVTEDMVGAAIVCAVVTEDMVGTELPYTRTLVERITFNGAGTEAYSTLKSGNILDDNGIINAVTFRYNTSKTETIKIDSNADGVADYDLPPETFAWLIGNVPQSRYELHYDIYLTGSMEGEAEYAESLLTNEYAVLKYNNYIGVDCSIEAPKPNRPWSKARVTTGYYLVNGKGQPIGSDGKPTDFNNAVRIDALGNAVQEFKLNATKIIDGDGAGQIPDAYQLYESEAEYSVLAQSAKPQVGRWLRRGMTTYVESGDIVLNEDLEDAGDFSDEQVKNLDYADTKVWFALVPKVCMDDTVVIDYGIPVDVDVLANDNFNKDGENASLIGYAPVVDDDPSSFDLTTDTPEGWVNTTKTIDGNFGKFSYTANNKIRYKLDAMQMSDVDSVTYGAQYSGDKMVKGKYYGNLTVIPATIIYYEDDYVSLTVHDYKSGEVKKDKSWTPVGTKKNDVQREDRVGETLANVYGHDGEYADSSTYSFGSAHKVTVSRTDKLNDAGKIESSTGEYAQAAFTFVGTGFDVISYTTNKTGTIAVQVFKYNSLDATELPSNPNIVKSTVVDTYYGYKYNKIPVLDDDGNQLVENGQPVYEYKWVPVTSNTESGLYQVPVIKVNCPEYGKYKVVITASYNWMFDHGQYAVTEGNDTRTGKYDFYLDAIRVYNPANDGANNDVIKNAYIADGEYMPEYKELRNILIESNKFAPDGLDIEGAVFIDNTSDSDKKSYSISEYESYGPNNEVYLANENAVAFTVNTNGKAEVHIGAKMVADSGKLTVTNLTNTKSKTLDIATATDIYYDISDILAENAENTVILENTGESGIVSITNLKLTKAVDTASSETPTVSSVYMNVKTAKAVVDYLNAVEAKPEIYSIKTIKRSVKAGKAFTVTVTTNSDAEYIVVNGETFTKYTENKFKNQRVWKVSLTLEEKGMTQISAYAYSAADVASRKLSTTVKVTKASAFSFGGIFDGFFGGLFGK